MNQIVASVEQAVSQTCKSQAEGIIRDCIYSSVWPKLLFEPLHCLLQEEGGNEHAKQLSAKPGELVDISAGS